MNATNLASANLFPALTGDVVTEGHARTCREKGHATHTVDGVTSDRCPRCGELVEAATAPAAVKPRCYREFCCNAATFEVEILDRSGRGLPAIPWGWCDQHKHEAWSQRNARR